MCSDVTQIKTCCSSGSFYHTGDDARLPTSSGRKSLYRGTFRLADDVGGDGRDALLVVFAGNASAQYAAEVACLGFGQAIGVGPELLATSASLTLGVGEGSARFALVEEYAGVSLADAIFRRVDIPFDGDDSLGGETLGAPGTFRREAEARKILFDVLVQLDNMHRNDLCHRDLRAANVCVKRFGPKPADLHATLVDFDLFSGAAPANKIAYDNEPYVHLFERLTGGKARQGGHEHVPTPLEIDMGYLAALAFELRTGLPATAASREELKNAFGGWPIFGYRADGSVFSRRIDQEIDIDPLAQSLGLSPLNEETYPDPALFERARQTIRHGGYVDACDRAKLARKHPEADMFVGIGDMVAAAYETYKHQAEISGFEVEYETVGEQPDSLSESTELQVRDIPNKVHALGYTIMRNDECPVGHRVKREFEPDELEYLSYLEHRRWMEERRDAGWVYAPEKDVNRRMSPYLVPYDKLDESIKEFDRSHVRDIPRLLALAGLVICG